MAAAGAGMLQPSTPGVLASVGCVDLAGPSAGSAVAASLVLRAPPTEGGRGALRFPTCAWGSRTGA
eukprot:2004952-Pleurochrysis_carterae.AAC.1